MTPLGPPGGISDDPQDGEDRNPAIPPTEGVVDETENNDKSESESENGNGNGNGNTNTPTNTNPRKGGSGLDPSKLNENAIQ